MLFEIRSLGPLREENAKKCICLYIKLVCIRFAYENFEVKPRTY